MSDKTYRAHLTAIHSGQVTATNVIGIRKAINARAWCDLVRRYHGKLPMTAYQLSEIRAAIYRKRPRVTGTLHETGLAVLRNPRYRKRFDERQTSIIHAPDAHFTLEGFEWITERTVTPVYAVWARQGDVLQGFTFRNIPWQSGGKGPEVVPHDWPR